MEGEGRVSGVKDGPPIPQGGRGEYAWMRALAMGGVALALDGKERYYSTRQRYLGIQRGMTFVMMGEWKGDISVGVPLDGGVCNTPLTTLLRHEVMPLPFAPSHDRKGLALAKRRSERCGAGCRVPSVRTCLLEIAARSHNIMIIIYHFS